MRHRQCNGDHHDSTLPSLTSSKLLTPFQGASYGDIYITVRCHLKEKKKEKRKKNYASSKKLLTSIKEKGPLGKKSPTRKEKGGSVRIGRVAGKQVSRPLLIGLKVGTMLKRTSGLNKLMSIVHRMSMEIECKFLDSL